MLKPGTGYVTKEEVSELLESLLDLEAFEIVFYEEESGTSVQIPYMMNDAVEFYLQLEECVIRGEWNGDEDNLEDYSFVANGDRDGLVLRQESGNTMTIWYSRIKKVAECYQYHRIGHAWRKEPGEESIRRLVNILCVLHDKYTYLGDDYSNEGEKELYALAEFGPLRYYTPINDSIMQWYPETPDGSEAMIRLAEKAGDTRLIASLRKYQDLVYSGKKYDRKVRPLAEELLKEEHKAVIALLEEEINQASLQWKMRDYGEENNRQIEDSRQAMVEKFRGLGYEGEYPVMSRRNKGGVVVKTVQFVEEHPFTTLEYEDYDFKIHVINK